MLTNLIRTVRDCIGGGYLIIGPLGKAAGQIDDRVNQTPMKELRFYFLFGVIPFPDCCSDLKSVWTERESVQRKT